MQPKLLVVDDDVGICTQMKWGLTQDFAVFLAKDRQSALRVFKQERPAVVTLDLGLPPTPHGAEEGFRTLQDILHEDVRAKVIVITGQEDHEHAVTAIGQGAYDFFRKPIQLDELKVLLGRALHVYQLDQEHWRRQQQGQQKGLESILGSCRPMQEIFTTIRRVATRDVSVVISGESGTGKELVARAIHQHSARCAGPFITINCAAIPENLLESELFGHEKGAFTGAHTPRQGRIELAQEGTLFLDEVGELALPLQVKLLRFLQEHQIERLGGRTPITIDVRVLAATNVNLTHAVAEGRFREDLYYRLAVVEIVLPPLRERGEDILLLAKAMLHRYVAESQHRIRGLSPEAIAALEMYAWPGNVRELENRIRRALIMTTGPLLTPEDLGLMVPEVTPGGQTLQEARTSVETTLIRRALARHAGNITHTANDLGVSRPTLRDLMRKHGLRA